MLTRILIGVTLLTLSITACSSGYTEDEVEATANAAYRLGHETGSAQQAAQTETLIVTNTDIVNNMSSWVGGSRCGADTCGRFYWKDSFGDSHSKFVQLGSQCWKDVTLGVDLPDSCR